MAKARWLFSDALDCSGKRLCSFLPAKDLFTVLARLNRKSLSLVRSYCLFPRRGRMVPYEGFAINELLVAFRFFAGRIPFEEVPPEITRIVAQSHSLGALLKPDLYEYLLKINAAMYHFLGPVPNWPGKNLFEQVQSLPGLTDYHHKVLWEDSRCWAFSRVSGSFLILFDRPDGTVLVSEDDLRVFLIVVTDEDTLGLPISIQSSFQITKRQSCFGRRGTLLHGAVRHIRMRGTLLSVQGKIISDGMATYTPAATADLQEAYRVYLHALETHTILTDLPRKPIYEIRQLSKGALKDLRFDLDEDVACIRAHPPAVESHCLWHFVTYGGYDEEANPGHLIQIISLPKGYSLIDTQDLPVKAIYHWRSEALEPTVEEFVRALRQCCERYQRKPHEVAIYHWGSLCNPVQELLAKTGVHVSYRFYPSIEQFWFHKTGDPYTHFDHPRCNVCGLGERQRRRRRQEQQEPILLVCPICQCVHYCGRDHQQADWPEHRTICSALKLRGPSKKESMLRVL